MSTAFAQFAQPFDFSWLAADRRGQRRHRPSCCWPASWAASSASSANSSTRHAGVRTNLLICMGSAFFTLLSAVLAGDASPDKGRVASNIVQGIGFLGAGLILHNRSRISGLTSAASVLVVASIGMACGAGLLRRGRRRGHHRDRRPRSRRHPREARQASKSIPGLRGPGQRPDCDASVHPRCHGQSRPAARDVRIATPSANCSGSAFRSPPQKNNMSVCAESCSPSPPSTQLLTFRDPEED